MRAKSKVAKSLSKMWEGSKEDKKQDKREAKKRGLSVKQFEGSPADEEKDKAGWKKAKRKRAVDDEEDEE